WHSGLSGLHFGRLRRRRDSEGRAEIMNLSGVAVIVLIGRVCLALPRNELRSAELRNRLAPGEQVAPDAIRLVRPEFADARDAVGEVAHGKGKRRSGYPTARVAPRSRGGWFHFRPFRPEDGPALLSVFRS